MGRRDCEGRLGAVRAGAVDRRGGAAGRDRAPRLDLDGFGRFALDLAGGRVREQPFVLAGQMTSADPSRSPAGTETLWAYTHVPRGSGTGPAAEVAEPGRKRHRAARARLRRPGWAARAARRPGCRRRTRTSTTVRSAAARQRCPSSWCSGRRPGSAGPTRRSTGSTWRRPRPTRAAACTAPAGRTRPEPRWPVTGRTGPVYRAAVGAAGRAVWGRTPGTGTHGGGR